MKEGFLRKSIFPLLLLLVVGTIFISDYQPGTYLLGWDSLQTELNPLLAIKRATHAGWQEYQSFGLTSGMAHAADIVRAVFMFMASLVLPQSFMRYFFHFSMMYLGGLGIFTLLQYLGFKDKKKIFAFIGACFYILNLGTVQIFSLPFEPFSVFFAFLPWEIYVFLKFAYAKKLSPRHIFSLVLVNILATPQAYLQTLFVVYILCLGFLAFGMLFENFSKKLLKRFIFAFGLIVLVNLFWILPQMYFLRTSLSVVKESKINQQATDVVNRQNIEKGTLRSFARLEGFYYDLYDSNDNPLFEPWHAHHGNVVITVLTYLPFVFLLFGIFKKHKSHYGFISIFVFVSLMLLSNAKALSYFNSVIFSHSFINQIFRSPFTKFIIPYSLVYSYLFVSGLDVVYGLVFKDADGENARYQSIIFTSIAMLLIVVYALPAFLGNYFSSSMKVKIPESYQKTMQYFKEQDKSKRIALLPDYTYWGWFSHEWGYDGSGFIWYGVEQPIVARTFDVWSLNSESYFWEIKYAIESKDAVLFDAVLDKYNIDYLIYDKTLNPISSVEEGMQYDQIDDILSKTQKVVKVKSFEKLDILMVNHDHDINEFVAISKDMPIVSPNIKITNLDQAHTQLGDYKVYKGMEADADVVAPDYIYPFLDLTTQTRVFDRKWDITEDDNHFYYKVDLSDYSLDEYNLEENPTTKDAKVFLGQTVVDYKYRIEEYWEGSTLVIKVGKELVESFDPTYVNVSNCGDIGSFGVAKRGTTLNVESVDRGIACFGYASGLLDHWNGYVVKLSSENVTGKELFFYIFGNKARKQSKLETNLKGGIEYFLLNPGYYYDDGYYFSFQNSSYKTIPSENNLLLLDVYLLPFEYLKNTRLVKKDLQNTPSFAVFGSNFESEKERYYSYKLVDRNYAGQDIVLYQSFDSGWGAYVVDQNSYWERSLPFLFAKKVPEHFVINNWANGWVMPEMGDDEYVLLYFWPQMLEYMGIIALVLVWNSVLIGAFLRIRMGKGLRTSPEQL